MTGCHHEEDTRTKDIVKILFDELGHQLILLHGNLFSLLLKHGVHLMQFLAVHDGLALLMSEIVQFAHQLVVFLQEFVQFVVERRASHAVLRIVNLE